MIIPSIFWLRIRTPNHALAYGWWVGTVGLLHMQQDRDTDLNGDVKNSLPPKSLNNSFTIVWLPFKKIWVKLT